MDKTNLRFDWISKTTIQKHWDDLTKDELLMYVDWLENRFLKNCSIPDVVLSLPDEEAIEQWWAEGKESDKFWQEAPYRTNGDVVEEIKTALKYFITTWQ